MKRSELKTLLSSVAGSCGYTLVEQTDSVGFERAGSFPLAVLAPPTLKSVDGRQRGVLCYRLKFRLMRLCMEFDAGEFERVSERMQDDAFDMVAALRQQVAVCDITGLKCTPLSEPVSAVRAVSMDVEMDLHAYFNNI